MGDNAINRIIKILKSKISIFKLLFLFIVLSCDEKPPSIQLIYPTDGMTLNEVITLQAEAYDNDGSGKIVSVEFYVDDQLITPVITSPNNDGIWECPFNISVWPDGNHIISAKAYDYSGNVGQSNVVNVTIPEGIVTTTSLYHPYYNEELVNVSIPTFSWYSTINIAEYDFEINKFSSLDEYYLFNSDLNPDPDFDQGYNYVVIDTLQENDGLVNFTIVDTLCNETSGFYWRVRTRSEIGDSINYGDWSQPSIFKLKGPDSPNLVSHLNALTSLPTFEWLQVPYALQYNIIVSRTIYDDDLCVGNSDLCFNGVNAVNDTIMRVPGQYQYYIPPNQVTIETGRHYWKVRSKNSSNIWGEWSLNSEFYMEPPDQINMIYPQNGQRISSTNQPNFNWDLNEVVEQYEFNLYTDLGYQKTVITDSDFFDMSFDDDTLETEVVYFCKVRGSNNTNAWNDWSEIIQFRITGPPAPNILAPLENQVFTENDVLKFIWDEPDASTDSIQIQINYDDNSFKFDTTISAQSNTLEFPHLESRNFFYKKQSYYRMRSKNNLGYLGAWSNCVIDNNGNEEHCNDIDYIQFYVRPDTPQQIYPLEFDDENNLIELIAQPTFSWDVSSGSDDLEFKIQIADNQLFRTDDIIVEEIVSGIEFNTSFNDFEDFQNRTLYWRVKSILYTDFGDIVEGDWSDTNLDNEDIDPASFRAIKPSVTNLQFPEDQLEINENIHFSWQEIYGAGNYQILVSNSPYFYDDNIVLDNIISGSNLINPEFVNELPIGNYYWKVRAKSELGIWGDYSETFSFYANIPQEINLLIPYNQSLHFNLTNFINFEWESNAVEQYHLVVKNKSNEIVFSDSSINTSNLSIDLFNLSQGTHYWEVRGINNMGLWSEWSEQYSFWIPYVLEFENIDVPSQNFEISKYPITNEQYVTFLNEAYHDPLEYLVIRDHYIKGYCPETGEDENEEQVYAKRATSNDIGEFNLPKIKWDSTQQSFYFEGSNQQLDFEDHPMVFVSWCGALGFAKHYNLEIPSKIEWEETASAFGWNDIELDNLNFNFLDSGDLWDNGTTPVDEYDNKVSSKIKDMLGNTCEWVNNNNQNNSNTICKGLSFKNLILDNIDNFPETEIINGKTSVHQDIGFRIIKRN